MFDVIIVVYNKQVDEIKSLSYFISSDLINKIIVCDNSVREKYYNKNLSGKLCYISMNGNKGLSKAYNEALKHVSSSFVCIADDDTEFPIDYFERASEYLSSDYDIYLPLVYSQNKILMSPCRKILFRFVPFTGKPSTGKNISAINSGMIVASRVYKKCKYSENLFLDMIDHKFMDDLKNVGFKIKIMHDNIITQDYSREIFNKDAQKRRMEISFSDNRVYYSHNFLSKIFCELQILYWKFSLIKKYSDISILFW